VDLIGLGIDVVDVDRASRFIRAHRSRLKSFLLPQEYHQFERSRYKTRFFALLFSAKEAVSKSLGVAVTHPQAFRDYLISCHGRKLTVRLNRRFDRGQRRLRIFLKSFRTSGSLGVVALAFKR